MSEESDCDARRLWNWSRGFISVVSFVLLCVIYVAVGRHAGWSYEQQPFAGPLSILVCTYGHGDFQLGLFWAIVLTPGICLPAFRTSFPTVVVCLIASLVWIAISLIVAANAAV